MIEIGDFVMTVVGLAAAGGIAMAGWAIRSTVDLRERMAVLESNRFTSVQAEQMKAELREEIHIGFDRVMRCIRQTRRGEDCDEPG